MKFDAGAFRSQMCGGLGLSFLIFPPSPGHGLMLLFEGTFILWNYDFSVTIG